MQVKEIVWYPTGPLGAIKLVRSSQVKEVKVERQKDIFDALRGMSRSTKTWCRLMLRAGRAQEDILAAIRRAKRKSRRSNRINSASIRFELYR